MAQSFLDRIAPKPNPKPALTVVTNADKYAKAALENAERAVAGAVEGTRNQTLNNEALSLFRRFVLSGKLDETVVRDVLHGAAQTAGLPDSEIAATLNSAYNGAVQKGAEPLAEREPRTTGVDPLAGMFTADEIGDDEGDPLVVHIPNMLTAGYSILGGSPKVGKSWLVLDIALACARGGLAMGNVSVKPRAVLYMALEDGKRRIRSRMNVLKHGKPKNLHILTELADGYSGLDTIKFWLDQHRNDEHPPLVIVDTLATIRPVVAANSSNAYDIDYEFGREMKKAADSVKGAAILAVHHNRKGDATDFIHKLSGSVGVTAACDCILALGRERGSDTAILSVTGKDLEREDDYSLQRDGALWTINGADMEEAAVAAAEQKHIGKLGDRSGEVLAVIEERGRRNELTVAADIGGIIPATQASSYLDRLFKAGRIQKIHRGAYFPVGVMYLNAAESPEASHES
ncbi:AAA family ATPase [Mycolicibacterium conceptionense]|uniref:AAA family ATPase n=1 Tax=Mycolicibacterium conceptionense TaxID=451644 RepID=UPI00336B0D46